MSSNQHPDKTQMMMGVVFASCRDDRQAWLGALQKSKVLHVLHVLCLQMLSGTTLKRQTVTLVSVNDIPAVIQSFLTLLLHPQPSRPLHNPAFVIAHRQHMTGSQ